ncbi:TPA: ash family protein [Mannheimia haemolytica]|nr:ash family protein [Mannheimia haemolytica]HDZ6813588.1 ash family protein [Mannheimia haemolytica]
MKTHNHYFKTNIDFVHHNSAKSENISRIHKLLNSVILSYYAHAVAKTTAEPGNSNNLYLANKSTPFNRAIFVCSTRTPKETTQLKIQPSEFLSMVACNGKGSPFAVFQVSQFSSLLHATAQTLESLAVAPQNLYLELSAMIYLFKAVSRLDLRKTQKPFTSFPHYTLKVKADSVEQAQAKISRLFAVLSVSVVNNSANITACDTEQNNSLLSLAGCGYDEVTTTYDGSRSRYTSGLFLPQIYQSHGLTTPESHSKFAVRVTLRNKANAIRTNKEGYSYVAVEPLSHPFSDKPLSLTKAYDTMKKPNTLYTANTGTQAPIALSSRFEGVAYA